MRKQHRMSKLPQKHVYLAETIARLCQGETKITWAHINTRVQKQSADVVSHSAIDLCLSYLLANGGCHKLNVAGDVYSFVPPDC